MKGKESSESGDTEVRFVDTLQDAEWRIINRMQMLEINWEWHEPHNTVTKKTM
jgi:hypothetical protein